MSTEQPRRTDVRRTQAERRAESERRLLQATAELIVERGLENTSLADIGRRAGASHAAVNHRFGSKEELVDRVVDEASLFYVRAARDRIGRHTGYEALVEICLLYLDLVDGPDPLGRVHIVLWSAAVAHTAPQRSTHLDTDRTFRTFLAGLITEGIEQGTIDPGVDAHDFAITIVGMLRGVSMQVLLDPDGLDLGAAKDVVTTLLARSLLQDP
ncbi:MAG: transcriptional regulator, TetR family [Marmoricola sp.]|nr:transcriptional regulator, TetR family [Marmoricola sp.]